MTRWIPLFAVALILTACDKKSEPEPDRPRKEAVAETVETETPETAEAEADPNTRTAARGGAPEGSEANPAPSSPEAGDSTEGIELPDDAKIPRVPHPEDEPEGHADEKAPPKGLMIGANNRWEIPRLLADRWESHPHRLGSAVEHGEGWKMVRVRNGSPGWWLGMRRGDVILTVNDMKLNTKPQLIAAYLKLKNKTEFEVKIDRDGTIRKHKYTIVD